MEEEAEAVLNTAKVELQDLVVVVSLVSTLTNSFGSASDLYRKLKSKAHTRHSDQQKYQGILEHEPFHVRRRIDVNRESGRHHHESLRKDDYRDSDEELIYTSSSQVRAEYDRGYRRHGESFARGDLTTKIQLQSQIIQLQQILLNINHDLLLSAYISPSSSHSHLVRLIQITRTARAASIRALKLQYQRMLLPRAPRSPERVIPGTLPLPLRESRKEPHDSKKWSPEWRKNKEDSGSYSSSNSETPRPKPNPNQRPHGNRLFCIVARDLQYRQGLPLTDNFKIGGDNMCPFCHSHIAVRPGKAWEIIVDGDKKFDEHTNTLSRTFLVKNRFLVKCHRENGGFACVLCARFKDSDTVCGKIEAVVEHLWKEHTCEELARDEDIVEC